MAAFQKRDKRRLIAKKKENRYSDRKRDDFGEVENAEIN